MTVLSRLGRVRRRAEFRPPDELPARIEVSGAAAVEAAAWAARNGYAISGFVRDGDRIGFTVDRRSGATTDQ